MRTIFLADAHLKVPTDKNYGLLLGFLDELAGRTDELYIMGDLFDFWIGFPSHPFPHYDAILDALERLVASGCRLVYFEGNHDFHLGDVFAVRLKAEIHTAPAIRIIQGKRLYLCHGDQINSADHGYRLLRLLLHNFLVSAAVTHFPLSAAHTIREKLQQRSRAGYHVKASRWNYREIIDEFAGSVRLKGCEGLVTGHFHLAFCERLPGSSFVILSLGDWMEQFTYGEMLDGEMRLLTYSGM